jgi:hypothetical protein
MAALLMETLGTDQLIQNVQGKGSLMDVIAAINEMVVSDALELEDNELPKLGDCIQSEYND